MKKTVILASLLFTAPALVAQIAFGGEPLSFSRQDLPEAPVVTLPTVDREALLAEDEWRRASGMKGPYRFGFNHATDLTLENSGVWHTLANGDRVWRLGLVCPGALSINLEFHDYVVPEGARVFVFNELGDHLGGFTQESSAGLHSMGVDLLAGERITVEYLEPAAVAGQGRLRIGQVTHGYRDVLGLMKGLGDSGPCNNNVKCPVGDPWRPQIRSVAIMMTGGSGFCTGQLINNCANDGTPYFLTARHCLGGSMANWVFRFNWESPNCTPTTNGPTNQSVSGATLMAQNAGTDAALLRLNSTPPANYNVFYTGWDKSGTTPASSVSIHHPSGDVKKISFDNQAAGTQTVNLGNGNATCWRILNWDSGTTETGSSGSGLWNPAGLLIGQLYGGQASCTNNVNDYYGKFDLSHAAFAQWLGNCGDQLPGYPQVASVQDTGEALELGLQPNPGDGRFTLTLPKLAQDATLVVHDVLGRAVWSANLAVGTERFELDLTGEAEGPYVIELRQGATRVVQRAVVQR
jgi:hypothetical protein